MREYLAEVASWNAPLSVEVGRQRNRRTKFFQNGGLIHFMCQDSCSHASQNSESKTSRKILEPRDFNMLQLHTLTQAIVHCNMHSVNQSGFQTCLFFANCLYINTTFQFKFGKVELFWCFQYGRSARTMSLISIVWSEWASALENTLAITCA